METRQPRGLKDLAGIRMPIMTRIGLRGKCCVCVCKTAFFVMDNSIHFCKPPIGDWKSLIDQKYSEFILSLATTVGIQANMSSSNHFLYKPIFFFTTPHRTGKCE